MAPWFTPRRCLVYSAYFVGVFSFCIGLFISKQVWTIHTTIRLIEKSWDLRGTDYRNVTWMDKAAHALLAGHEDRSEYNDMFWAKYAELDTAENVQGSFNRSNLTTTCKPGYAPEWVGANIGYDKWGFVLYRTDYDEDNETWAETVKHINHTIRAHLEIEATHDGIECDPDLVRDRAVLEIIEDRETLDFAEPEKIRSLWRERVDAGLVGGGFKIGTWNHGWSRLSLKCDESMQGKRCEKPNGMALNLCLVYDHNSRLMMWLAENGVPATGPRDPWEPFLLAIDGIWSNDTYMYRTSWAYGYPGSYGVALSILFNNFHRETFDREMERQSPYMYHGAPLVDGQAPRWLQFLQSLLNTSPAVARPGHFPFDKRWQELEYPFVREDSHWRDPDKTENIPVDESETLPQESATLDLESLLNPSPFKHYVHCSRSDEDQEGCFQMGNFYLREPRPHKTPHVTEEAVPANDIAQDASEERDAVVEQDDAVEKDNVVEEDPS